MSGSPTNTAWQRMAPTLTTFVLVVLVAACLYWARPVLIPLAMALLVSFMLGPAVIWLQRRGLSRMPAVFTVIGLAGFILSVAMWVVGSQVITLVDDLPTYQTNVAKRIAEVREHGNGKLLRNVQRFVHVITTAATQPTQPLPIDENQPVSVTIVEQAAASSLGAWMTGLQPVAEPVLTTGGVFVLVIYMLIFREDLRSRILSLVGRGRLTVTTKALDDAGRRISRYLLAQFALNLGFGVVVTIGLWALGVPHPALWGFMAGVLRYIPYLGPWLAAIFPIGMTLLISDGWMQPLAVVALFVVAESVSNLIVEPWLYGQSIGVSQAALMVAIIFWTWLWGAVGLMLAAPLTTCLVVLGKYVPALKFFDILLGDEQGLAPDVHLYQRLLARDEDEATELVRRHAQTMSPVEVCDGIFIPALVHARYDFQEGLLSTDEFEFVLTAVQSIADEQELATLAAAGKAAKGKIEESDPNLPARPPLTILGCPAQNAAEATALALFQQLLDPVKFQMEMASAKSLVSEVVELVEARRPAVICIAALPAGGLAHTRHLCKRLHGRFSTQKILVCRWGGKLEDQEQWAGCGADYIGTTFEESIRQLDELAQFLRPVATERPEPAPAAITPSEGVVEAPDSAPFAPAASMT